MVNFFGASLSGDGQSLVVGANNEHGPEAGISGNDTSNGTSLSGAVYY